jgi:extradiol dioxygenase family protein
VAAANPGSINEATSLLTPFHVAVRVRDIPEARDFHGRRLRFPEGRSCAQWIDFDLFGHQYVAHLGIQSELFAR